MNKFIFFLFLVSINLITDCQNIIGQFNNIDNYNKAEKFISENRYIIPSKHYRIIDSQYDLTRQDQILLSLETGDTVTIKQYLNKIIQSQTYTSCWAESFRLKVPVDNRLKADSILSVIQARLGNGELFSEIGREYSIDNEDTVNHEYRLHDNEEDEFTRSILDADSGQVCLAPYLPGNFYYVVKKTSSNYNGKVSTAFRIYSSDYCSLLPPQKTVYRIFNKNNDLSLILIKEISKNSVIYTKYLFPENNISREIITRKIYDNSYYNPEDFFESGMFTNEDKKETITYEYYSCDSSTIRQAKNPQKFISLNKPTNISFQRYNKTIFCLKNDTLIRKDFVENEFNPESRIFKYSDSLITVYSYSLVLDTIFGEKSFLINSSDKGNILKRQWLHSDAFQLNSYKPNPTTEIYYNDSVKFSKREYHYNNEPQWMRILNITHIEDNGYINYYHEIDTKLISQIYLYKSDNIIFTTEIKKDQKGRIIEILFKENGQMYQRIEIEY